MFDKDTARSPDSVEFYLLINPAKISLLRFILEGYDGLAVLSTISAKTGLVRIWTLSGQFVDTMRLVNNLAYDLTQDPHLK